MYYALVEPGDTVISVSPTYQQLYSVAESLGATVKILHLRRERGYLPDIGELRSLVDDKTRLIVINNPNNPTGALMDEDLMREIVSVAEDCGAYVHCDEVYRGLEHAPESQGPSIVSLYEQGISTGSMSKAFSLAGLRTGWVVASSDVLSRVLVHRDYTTISCGAVDDVLAAVALANADKILARNVALLQKTQRFWVIGSAQNRVWTMSRREPGQRRLSNTATRCPRSNSVKGSFVIAGPSWRPGRALTARARSAWVLAVQRKCLTAHLRASPGTCASLTSPKRVVSVHCWQAPVPASQAVDDGPDVRFPFAFVCPQARDGGASHEGSPSRAFRGCESPRGTASGAAVSSMYRSRTRRQRAAADGSPTRRLTTAHALVQRSSSASRNPHFAAQSRIADYRPTPLRWVSQMVSLVRFQRGHQFCLLMLSGVFDGWTLGVVELVPEIICIPLC